MPTREERNEFVVWYRNQHSDELDEFDKDTFNLTKDGILEDDFEINIDELEMQMLEAEMKGEKIPTSYNPDDYDKIDDEQILSAIMIAERSGHISDPEELLRQIETVKTLNKHNNEEVTN